MINGVVLLSLAVPYALPKSPLLKLYLPIYCKFQLSTSSRLKGPFLDFRISTLRLNFYS